MIKIYFVAIILFFLSCKNNSIESEVDSKISTLQEEYNKTKADSSFNKLVQAYGQSIMETKDKKQKEILLNNAISLCNAPEKSNLKEIFSTELIKLNPNVNSANDIIWNLAQSMLVRGKNEVASILFKGFKEKFPADPRSKETEKLILAEQKDIHAYIKSLAERVFENPGANGLNDENTQKYIDVCESFALVYSADKMAAEYLFRAAEMSRAISGFSKMMSLYDWIYQYFPDYKKAPLALFLKGFAMDSEFKQPAEAKKIYDQFLLEFPNDSLAKDVTFLLKNLGKSDEEILKEIEKSQK
ncbi:MAG: tetratricopeptide repeat protein [Saprospiraceae bacterium]|nr:tetratricopeptide repeat protein [Saprospiraceae bacterium]